MPVAREDRIRTYIEGLDRALSGGIPRGHIVLLTGYPGTMKSSLAYSILNQNAAQAGLKSVYITLEQSRESLRKQVEALGIDTAPAGDRVSVVDLSQIRKNLAAASRKTPFLQIFTTYVKNVVGGHEASLVVVDSLNVLETIANWDHRRSNLFHLFELFRGLETTTILIDEGSMDLHSGERGRDEAYLADTILDLSLQPVGETEAQRRIRCVKMRWSAHETTSFAFLWTGRGFDTTRSVAVTSAKVVR